MGKARVVGVESPRVGRVPRSAEKCESHATIPGTILEHWLTSHKRGAQSCRTHSHSARMNDAFAASSMLHRSNREVVNQPSAEWMSRHRIT